MPPVYNLLVTLVPRAWERTAFVLERGRVLEYSDAPLQKKFRALSARAIQQLVQLPCLFAYEQQVSADARLGRITRIQRRRHDVRIEFHIDRASPPVPRELLDKSRSDFDLAAGELSRTHWAVKDVALLEMLETRGLLTARERRRLQRALQPAAEMAQARRISVTPSVFRIPKAGIDRKLVSVMMPFAPALRPVYEALVRACAELGLQCRRADDIWDESEVIQDVFSLIWRSAVVISDFSERNSNVFYETGIAHTLGKPVIPILQQRGDAPFDLKHHRYIEYRNSASGRAALARKVSERLRTLLK